MILNTKDFQAAANKILVAVDLDKNATNLELVAKGTFLFLNVTNTEYYVSVKFTLGESADFRAVVDASLFLTLIAGITTETFEINLKDNYLYVISNKSKYKVALIYENDNLMQLPIISLGNKTVQMTISNDILLSILNVNGKEIQKAKKLDVAELQRLYYIDETGCFTFTSSACLNSFKLEKPVKLLLNEKIVKLFKLFSTDILFSFGYDADTLGNLKPKAIFETDDIYVAARITCDDILLHKIKGPCEAAKTLIEQAYPNNLVLSASSLLDAISRLMLFTKNNSASVNMFYIPMVVSVTNSELTIKDDQDNCEVIQIENGSAISSNYTMKLNINDLKSIVEACKNDHITMNCGNGRSVVVSRGQISSVISELRS